MFHLGKGIFFFRGEISGFLFFFLRFHPQASVRCICGSYRYFCILRHAMASADVISADFTIMFCYHCSSIMVRMTKGVTLIGHSCSCTLHLLRGASASFPLYISLQSSFLHGFQFSSFSIFFSNFQLIIGFRHHISDEDCIGFHRSALRLMS